MSVTEGTKAVVGFTIGGEGLVVVKSGFWRDGEEGGIWNWDGVGGMNILFSYSGPRKGVDAERLGRLGGAVVGLARSSSLPAVNENSGAGVGLSVVGACKRGVAGGRGNDVSAGDSVTLSLVSGVWRWCCRF